MPDFTIGQRVKSAPGLSWMPIQRSGTVIETNHTLIIVLLDGTPHRPRGERRSFLRKNLVPADQSWRASVSCSGGDAVVGLYGTNESQSSVTGLK